MLSIGKQYVLCMASRHVTSFMLEMLLKLTKNNSNLAKINEQYLSRKLLSPGMYKESLT